MSMSRVRLNTPSLAYKAEQCKASQSHWPISPEYTSNPCNPLQSLILCRLLITSVPLHTANPSFYKNSKHKQYMSLHCLAHNTYFNVIEITRIISGQLKMYNYRIYLQISLPFIHVIYIFIIVLPTL